MPTKVAGVKQTRRALMDGRAKKVFLARDADPALLSSLEELCREHQVAAEWCSSMREVGRLCGIAVGAAAAAEIF